MEGEYKLIEPHEGRKNLIVSPKVENMPTPLSRNSIPEQDFPQMAAQCALLGHMCVEMLILEACGQVEKEGSTAFLKFRPGFLWTFNKVPHLFP